MSSKFRARALDASKPMPVFLTDELPDLPDFAAINRAVPQMPSGMEKEEECEHHLQRAMSAQQAYGQTGDLVIPTPEVYNCIEDFENIYPSDYKIPRQLIHMQPFGVEHDVPDYDLDTEDELWVNQQAKKMAITPIQFEEMMDRLEKGSGQQVVKLKEAKLLLKEDDDLIIAVYDYWLNKRLKTQHPLIPQVKNEKRDGSTNNNPYVAFRRRTEKMQTRKNRKNDEASYEKMLKLRRDISRAVTLCEMVKRREKTKREHIHLMIEVYAKRYQIGDFSGQILAEVSALRHPRPSLVSVSNAANQYAMNKPNEWTSRLSKTDAAPRKKREYKRRKLKQAQQSNAQMQANSRFVDIDGYGINASSEEETFSAGASPSEQEDENDPDGVFAFKRKKHCSYHAPIVGSTGNWPWCAPEEGGLADRRYRYCLTSLSVPRQRCVGFARRRIGRGGRILLDRAWTPLDDWWPELDGTRTAPNGLQSANEFAAEIRNEWLHFRPQSPPAVDSACCQSQSPSNSRTGCGNGSGDPLEFNVESFQSHQEELLEMQRKQLERLQRGERQDLHSSSVSSSCHPALSGFSSAASPSSALSMRTCSSSSSSHPNPSCSSNAAASDSSSNPHHFTLDSASAQFAVSAVVNATQVSGLLSAKNSSSASLPVSVSALVANGPSYNSTLAPGAEMSGMVHRHSAFANKAVSQSWHVVTSEVKQNNRTPVASDNQDEKTNRKVKVDSILNENSLPMEVT